MVMWLVLLSANSTNAGSKTGQDEFQVLSQSALTSYKLFFLLFIFKYFYSVFYWKLLHFCAILFNTKFNGCKPAHSWYRSEGPGAAICFKGDRKDQTALARLSSGHLKTLRFSHGDKKFNICTKCNMMEATSQRLLGCVALVYDDLFKRPDFVLEVMKANDLMDLT
ncbi:hypothetical protein AVEN_92192-1 [Araneus ventricosus]|uniref:Uncharacterized protein n=1 Tax=Araneus ventricosus TaxID=182803 RepID=A0A4Y2ALX8_ARAVE|nr:hypothetical protein AVEN_92192-1 [Araneus ventricosus]